MTRPEEDAARAELERQGLNPWVNANGYTRLIDDDGDIVFINIPALVDAVLAAADAKAMRLERYIVAANHPDTTPMPREQYWAIVDEKNAALNALQPGDIPADVRARMF